MRTKLLSFFVIFFLAGSLQADDISVEQALSIAERFFAGQHASVKANARSDAKASAMTVAYTSLRKGGEAALYVINRGGDSGFVLVTVKTQKAVGFLQTCGWGMMMPDGTSFAADRGEEK